MNWDALGAVAELLGGLGVIITLIFLAFQIRHNASALQSETLAALTHNMTSNMMVFAQSGELSQLLRGGLNNLNSLSEADQFRFHISMSTTLRHFETAFFAYRKGLLEGQSWMSIEAMLLQLLEKRGVLAYWASQRDVFSDTFRDYVQDRIEIRAQSQLQRRVGQTLADPGLAPTDGGRSLLFINTYADHHSPTPSNQ